MTVNMHFSRCFLLQFALVAFVFSAVVPFFALYDGQIAKADNVTLAALYGEEIFMCTERGFEMVKLADVQNGKHVPKRDTHFECALCFVGAKGAKHSQLAPMELALSLHPERALQLHFAQPVVLAGNHSAATPSIPRAPPVVM